MEAITKPFTKEQVQALKAINFTKWSSWWYEDKTPDTDTLMACYEGSFEVSYSMDNFANRKYFIEFADAINFIKGLFI